MTTQADIKLVIDQLHGMELTPSTDEVIIFNTVNALETLGNQVAEQAAHIAYLKDFVFDYVDVEPNNELMLAKYYKATRECDSKQILKEWLDEKLGDPVGYHHKSIPNETSFDHLDFDSYEDDYGRKHWVSTPLFKKPDMTGMTIDGS